MSEMALFVDKHNDTTCVAFIKGSADLAGHDQFQKFIQDVMTNPAKNVVLDIRQLTFVTSLAVGDMIALSKAKKKVGGQVVIAGPSDYVGGVLKAARVSQMIPIYGTVDEAVAAVS